MIHMPWIKLINHFLFEIEKEYIIKIDEYKSL